MSIIKSAHRPVILITGGARLLGMELAKKLALKNFQLILLDNLSVGNYLNLRALTPHKNITFINCDINEGLPQSIREVSYIFHLAATKTSWVDNPPTSLYDLTTNSLGTRNLLDLANRTEARLVYTSSILLYSSAIEKIRQTSEPNGGQPFEGTHPTAKRFGESLIEQYIQAQKVDARIVRLPHIYGPGMSLEGDAPLGRILSDVLKTNKIILRGDGSAKHYYLHISDAVEGLCRAMFNPKARGLIFPLIPEETVSELQITKCLSDTLKMEVDKEAGSLSSYAPLLHIEGLENLEILDWKAVTTFKEGLQETLQSLPGVVEADEYSVPEVKKSPKRRESFSVLRKPLTVASKAVKNIANSRGKKKQNYQRLITLSLLALLLSFLTLFPLVELGYHTKQGTRSLILAESNLKSFNFEEGGAKSQESLYHFQKAIKISNSRNIWYLLRLNPKTAPLQRLLTAGEFLSRAGESANKGASIVTQAILESTPALLNGQSKETLSPEVFQQTLSEFSSAQSYTSLAEAELKEINLADLPFQSWKQEVSALQEKVNEAQHSLEQVKLLTQAMPAIMGYSKPTSFLFLIQNSNEIRASGGFIGSLAEVTVKEGTISEIRVDDVYNPDGVLLEKNIVIEPPPPLKHILGQNRWFLRDSNWDADFSEASEDISNFYFLETGKRVDTILALDLHLIKKILEVTGPITVATYDEEVTAGNLFEKAEMYSEAGFVPGTSFKKTFLTTLSQQLITSLVQMKQDQYSKLPPAFYNSLNEKHLLLNTNIPALQKLTQTNNWAGEVSKTQGNYFYAVDSNLGANKANYYAPSTQELDVESQNSDGRQINKATLTYVHTGTSDAWPGGKYNNYLRVLVPEGSHLLSATQNQSESKDRKQDVTKDVSVLEESGKTVLAKHLELDHGQSLTLILRYELPKTLALTSTVKEYNLLIQKQPGTVGDGLLVTINPPFGRDFTVPSNMERIGRSLRFVGKLTQDQAFKITMN